MSLQNEGFRFLVSRDRKQANWIHPAEIERRAKDWIDCTDMTDAEFDRFMARELLEGGDMKYPKPYSDEARTAFEEWAEIRGYSMVRTTDSYKSQGTKSAWRGWNGAIRALAESASLAEVPNG